MDKENEVLLNTFVISKKKYRVVYNAGLLVWEAENSKKEKISVPVSDIISVTLSTTASGRSSVKNAPHAVTTTYGTTSSAHAPMNEDIGFDRIPVLQSSASISTNDTLNTVTTTTNISTRANSDDLLHSANGEEIISGNNQCEGNYLIIHFARLVSSRTCKWRVQQLVLFKNEQRIIKLWYHRLSEDIRAQNRPTNLLLFLNPYGGKRKAFALFEKHAKPLFKLAQVDINLIITQRAQQIYDILTSQTINLNNYDGLICCGGDGTFAELFNGLVYRTMIDLGIDINKPPYLPRPSIPIGIIPAGSTDTVSYCLNGTTDIKTSIIHIILGQTHGLDISSVYRNSDDNGGQVQINGDPKGSNINYPATSSKITNHTKRRSQLLKLYASVLSYGFLGDVTLESENYRWMGPKRYDYSGAKKFFRNRGYSGDITIYLEKEVINDVRVDRNNPHDGVRCLNNCPRCQNAFVKSGNPVDCDTEAVTVSGKFLMVSGANISCACSRSPQGFNPYCHLGDGYLDLVLVRHTSFFNNIRLLLAMSSKTKKISDLPFVEIYRTKKFSFNGRIATAFQRHGHDNDAVDDELDLTGTISASSASPNIANSTVAVSRIAAGSLKEDNKLLSKWNCDGEILMDTNITVECNCQLINVFRRGISCSDNRCTKNDAGILNCCGVCK